MSQTSIDKTLVNRFLAVRDYTKTLAAPLSPEDQQIQSMPDASPTKWHLAHTTWFFETFLLKPHLNSYEPYDASFEFLYNSYYEAVGERHQRDQRGLITRPSNDEVAEYRTHVDAGMEKLLVSTLDTQSEDSTTAERVRELVELGMNHEQQHQELLLTDIKHALAQNPTNPLYRKRPAPSHQKQELEISQTKSWVEFDGGLATIGQNVDETESFGFDNEGPAHQVFLEPYRLGKRLVTCGDWLDFMADDGYHKAELWLSEGWAAVNSQQWDSPLYWEASASGWKMHTLHDFQPINSNEPISHISYFEADAFARWSQARLPTEAEWESAAKLVDDSQAAVEHHDQFHPQPTQPSKADKSDTLEQLYSDVWQWTSSSYGPYPRFKAAPGAVGEYNGKFMVNQYVLRGGCCATSPGHSRATYRNFFPAKSRWAFSGLRLAESQ